MVNTAASRCARLEWVVDDHPRLRHALAWWSQSLFAWPHGRTARLAVAIVQVVLATVDVAVTATIFFALLPPAPGLTWLIFLGVYVASYTAGLAANLPGGIGVFDTAMLFGLETPYMSPPYIVGAIMYFPRKHACYVVPLFLAGFRCSPTTRSSCAAAACFGICANCRRCRRLAGGASRTSRSPPRLAPWFSAAF